MRIRLEVWITAGLIVAVFLSGWLLGFWQNAWPLIFDSEGPAGLSQDFSLNIIVQLLFAFIQIIVIGVFVSWLVERRTYRRWQSTRGTMIGNLRQMNYIIFWLSNDILASENVIDRPEMKQLLNRLSNHIDRSQFSIDRNRYSLNPDFAETIAAYERDLAYIGALAQAIPQRRTYIYASEGQYVSQPFSFAGCLRNLTRLEKLAGIPTRGREALIDRVHEIAAQLDRKYPDFVKVVPLDVARIEQLAARDRPDYIPNLQSPVPY